jgi:hypothetical protein
VARGRPKLNVGIVHVLFSSRKFFFLFAIGVKRCATRAQVKTTVRSLGGEYASTFGGDKESITAQKIAQIATTPGFVQELAKSRSEEKAS